MKTYTKIYQGATIETFRSEQTEYVQRGQFCYYRKANDWCVTINGTLADRGFGTKAAALAFGKKLVDRKAPSNCPE